ncbi:MAG: glycosyltransferase family 2 protein [Desulfarculaceae bacterium]|nr:glycosyltransferase family 2 protein [Desulfarculaceae bacterium]
MPNRNHGAYLPISIGALGKQTPRPDKIIVIDDASTDDSLEVLARLAKAHPNLEVHENPERLGVVGTQNRLIDLADGEYIYFASADDMVLPGFFRTGLDLLRANPSAALFSGLTAYIGPAGNLQGLMPLPTPCDRACFLSPQKCRRLLYEHNVWFHGSSCLIRRDRVPAQKLNPELDFLADNFFWQEIILRHGAVFAPVPCACYRRQGGSYSGGALRDTGKISAVLSLVRESMQQRPELFSRPYVEAYQKSLRLGFVSECVWSDQVNTEQKARVIAQLVPGLGPAARLAVNAGLSGPRPMSYLLLLALRLRSGLLNAGFLKRKFREIPRKKKGLQSIREVWEALPAQDEF